MISNIKNAEPIALKAECTLENGMSNKRVFTIPVPIVTENQEGVNRMILNLNPLARAAKRGCPVVAVVVAALEPVIPPGLNSAPPSPFEVAVSCC